MTNILITIVVLVACFCLGVVLGTAWAYWRLGEQPVLPPDDKMPPPPLPPIDRTPQQWWDSNPNASPYAPKPKRISPNREALRAIWWQAKLEQIKKPARYQIVPPRNKSVASAPPAAKPERAMPTAELLPSINWGSR